jgi:hypothetical protein
MTNPRPKPGGKVRVLRRQVKQPFTRDVVLVVRCQRVDQAVLGRFGDDLASDSTVQLLLLTLEQLASGDSKPVDGRSLAALEKRVATLTTQIGRTVDLAAAMEDPAPILRRVSDLEHQRAEFVAQLNELRARKQQAQAAGAGAIEPDQVRTLLRRLMPEIAERAEEPDHRAEARQVRGARARCA